MGNLTIFQTGIDPEKVSNAVTNTLDNVVAEVINWRAGLGDVGPANDYIDFSGPADLAGICEAVNEAFASLCSEMRVAEGPGIIIPATSGVGPSDMIRQFNLDRINGD